MSEQSPAQVERVTLSAPHMSELLPRMRALQAAGWALQRMTKPMAEGHGGEVEAVFVRDPGEH